MKILEGINYITKTINMTAKRHQMVKIDTKLVKQKY